MSDEFYVLINKENLNFYEDEYNDTININKAMKFYILEQCYDELSKFDDGIKEKYEIYKAVNQLMTKFERVGKL